MRDPFTRSWMTTGEVLLKWGVRKLIGINDLSGAKCKNSNGNGGQMSYRGPEKKSYPSLETGRCWGISACFSRFERQWFACWKFSPMRTAQQGERDAPDTHCTGSWALSPAGLLCVTWHGDGFSLAGSKHPRANCENSKAKKGFRWSGRYLGTKFPGVLISCSILLMGLGRI